MPGSAPQIQYRQEFVLGFAQRASLLRDTVTRESVVKGNQATFLVANYTGQVVSRGVNGYIPYQDNDNAQVTATLVERHSPFEMTGFNIFQSQADQRAIMQMNSMTGINRDIDEFILGELANGTLDTGATATASLTMISKAIATLQNNGVPWDDGLFAVISPAFLMYLQTIPSWASHDYVDVKPFVNFPGVEATTTTGRPKVVRWMNINWIVTGRISGAGTAAEKCYMYHRSALGYAVNSQDIMTAIGYDEKQDISWARASLFHGAKLLQNSGIVQMLHDGSAFVAT